MMVSAGRSRLPAAVKEAGCLILLVHYGGRRAAYARALSPGLSAALGLLPIWLILQGSRRARGSTSTLVDALWHLRPCASSVGTTQAGIIRQLPKQLGWSCRLEF
jgi:hypothetical protein